MRANMSCPGYVLRMWKLISDKQQCSKQGKNGEYWELRYISLAHRKLNV